MVKIAIAQMDPKVSRNNRIYKMGLVQITNLGVGAELNEYPVSIPTQTAHLKCFMRCPFDNLFD